MKKIFSRRSYFLSTLFLLALFLTAASQSLNVVRALASSSLSGYAWSDTIGWISFSGSSPAYGVSEDGSGNLTGYAWSDNIGWIKFGGLSSFPSGGGTSNENAVIDSSGNLHGWARACAGTASGDCSSMTSRTDGWDGWISLDGTNYGVNFASGNGQYSQGAYTWGSDVVGWITFNPSNLSSTTNPTCNPALEICGGGAPAGLTATVNVSVTPSSVTAGTAATLTWSTTNVTTCSASSTGISTDSHWNGSFSSLGYATSSGSQSTSVFNTAGSETYGLTCTATSQAGGGSISGIPVTLTVNASSSGQSSMCTSVPSNATLCSGSASGNTSSSLVSTCSASGGTPLCQYACSAGYRKVGNQCVGNGSIQEQ